MSDIQVGTSTFSSSDFLVAVQDELSCGDCGHCQQNKKILDRVMDWTCYHHNNMQHNISGEQGMAVSDSFLCSNFELFD